MHFGLTGLAVMGQNLVRNIASRGFPIAVHNRTTEKTDTFVQEHGGESEIVAGRSVEEYVGALERPRAVMIMVKAGSPNRVDVRCQFVAARIPACRVAR
jgi:6-phosphogluconate dehydrogenase